METINYISVIIPLYNKVKYIERSIHSVINQTYQYFEIIVVNDGSLDGSELLVNNFLDNRIKLINQSNLGVSVARNIGVKNASFEYIAFLDADDEWSPFFLESINNLINNFPESGIYATNNYFVFQNGKVKYEDYSKLFKNSNIGIIDNYFKIFADRKKSPFSNSNFCMSKKVFLDYNGYKLGVKLTEDSDLWCRVALDKRIAYDIRPNAFYYFETENSTNVIFVNEEFEVIKTLKKALVSIGENTEIRGSIKKLIAFQQLSYTKRAIITKNNKQAFKTLFSSTIIYYYPIDFFICFLNAFLPTFSINFFRTLKLKI